MSPGGKLAARAVVWIFQAFAFGLGVAAIVVSIGDLTDLADLTPGGGSTRSRQDYATLGVLAGCGVLGAYLGMRRLSPSIAVKVSIAIGAALAATVVLLIAVALTRNAVSGPEERATVDLITGVLAVVLASVVPLVLRRRGPAGWRGRHHPDGVARP